MNLRDRARRSFILVAALSVIFASGAFATDHELQEESTDVNVLAFHGDRSMAVSNQSGLPLSAVSLRETASEAPFLVTVNDVTYDNVGYQVTATMSTLYLDGTDCENYIESENLGIGFADGALPTLEDILAHADPLLEYSGDLAGVDLGSAVLNNALGGLLGSTELVVEDVQGLLQDVIDLMPIGVDLGAGADFENAAPHGSGCDATAGIDTSDPTPVKIQSGEPNDIAGDLKDAVLDAITSAQDAIDNDLVDEQTLRDTVAEALADLLGVDLSLIDDNAINAALDRLVLDEAASLVDLLGQTGVYIAPPKLLLNDTAGAKTGLYHGTMTVTLADVRD